MFVCDICNSGEDGNGFVFPSFDMRLAYRGGLLTEGLPELGVLDAKSAAAFKALVMSENDDWELCGKCSARVSEAIQAFGPTIKRNITIGLSN